MDPLLDELNRLRRQAGGTIATGQETRSNRAETDLRAFGRFTYQLGAGFLWVRRWVLAPVWRAIWRAWKWIVRQYRRLWAYCVYKRMPDGRLLFSKTRAGLMVLATGVFLWFGLLDALDFAWDCGVYALTAKVDEHIYLNGSQEINSWTGAHTIEGCSRLPCSDDDAIYFRTNGGWFNNLWSLSHGKGFFLPEYVGAAVPYQTSQCLVTSYGFRFRFLRYVNVYPDLLAVTCKPIEQPPRT